MTTTIEDGVRRAPDDEKRLPAQQRAHRFLLRDDEDGKPVANRVEAGKRPRSSMAPTIVSTTATSSMRSSGRREAA